jgi:SAM-dependent methyltransferase
MMSLMDDYLHALRRYELGVATGLVPFQGKRVLEIGAGDGFLASLLSEIATVEAIDVYRHPRAVHPVQLYDGRALSFSDGTFDIVFSSNVLEHIPDLPRLLDEMARVLKPDGIGVHIVPTSTWRVATSISHYPAIPLFLLNRNRLASSGEAAPRGSRLRWLLGRVLVSGRHGEKGNALTEIWRFSEAGWRRSLAGWDISWHPSGLFYSGHAIFGSRISLDRRRATGLSSTAVIVARPRRGLA